MDNDGGCLDMNYSKEYGVQASNKESEAASLGTKAPSMCYFTTVPASTPLPISFPHSPGEHLLREMTMEHETQTDKPPQCKDAQPSPPPPRRSRRLAAKPLKTADAPGTMGEPRRNPKRKASEAANEVNHAISKESGQLLLNEALAPLSQEDIQEWEGWIALESEPVSAWCPLVRSEI